MRIGLISDTHIPESFPDLFPQIIDGFRNVDVILHAGDLHQLDVVDQLNELAPYMSQEEMAMRDPGDAYPYLKMIALKRPGCLSGRESQSA